MDVPKAKVARVNGRLDPRSRPCKTIGMRLNQHPSPIPLPATTLPSNSFGLTSDRLRILLKVCAEIENLVWNDI